MKTATFCERDATVKKNAKYYLFHTILLHGLITC